MNSQGSSSGQEGSVGNGLGRRIALDLDLNNPPPDENLSPSYPSMGQGNGISHGQTTDGVEFDDDDDVAMLSPGNFAEATRNARRDQEQKFEFPEGSLLLAYLQCGSEANLTAVRIMDGSLRAEDLLVPQVPHPPPMAPIPHAQVYPETSSQQDLNTFTCGICMDQLTEETATKCGHIFCKQCIETAIVSQRKCPTCRQKLNRKDTIRIYLPRSG